MPCGGFPCASQCRFRARLHLNVQGNCRSDLLFRYQRLALASISGTTVVQRSKAQARRQGVKISFAAENDPPGLGPPAITYIFPATTALPSPWRAVGIGVYSLQVSLGGA